MKFTFTLDPEACVVMAVFTEPPTNAPIPRKGQDPAASPTLAHPPRVFDIGSGAGFPGLPVKIWAPHIRLTLVESNHKKATFLREVIRALTLTDVNVFAGRAQDLHARVLVAKTEPNPFPHAPRPPHQTAAQIVTLRAVEHFDAILPVAASLVAPGGRLALLIGEPQLHRVHTLLPHLNWAPPIPIPQSDKRVLTIGTSEPTR